MSEHLEAVPDPQPEPEPDEMAQWLTRWGSSEIVLDDDGRWSIFEADDWAEFPGKLNQQLAALLCLHVMAGDAIAVLDEEGGIDHWRRLDRDTHTYRPLSAKALRALATAVIGNVDNDTQINGAVKMIDDNAMGPPQQVGKIVLGRPRCVSVERLDDNPRYRAALNGWIDLRANELIDDIEEIKALGLYLTRCLPVPFVKDADLRDPDIAERMELIFDGFEPNADSDDEWTDEEWFWAQAGHTCWNKPNRRIVIIVGAPGAGKSTRLMALVAADGDYAIDGRISDLTAKHHEPRFSIKRAWCEAPLVAYDDGPDDRWHWSSILPGSAGAVMTCEIKNGGHLRLPSISTPWIAMNPKRLKWIGVNTEGGPERVKILKLTDRPAEEEDPDDLLDEYGYDSVQEMATKDPMLHIGIVARRARYASLWRRKPPDTANVERNGLEVQQTALPPVEAWLTDVLKFGEGRRMYWDDLLKKAADDHPKGSVDPWPLETDRHEWTGKSRTFITVPRKGDGLEELTSTGLAKRARDLFPGQFRAVKSESDGHGRRVLIGVGFDE